MEDPLNYDHELGIKSRVETFFTQYGPFSREHPGEPYTWSGPKLVPSQFMYQRQQSLLR